MRFVCTRVRARIVGRTRHNQYLDIIYPFPFLFFVVIIQFSHFLNFFKF